MSHVDDKVIWLDFRSMKHARWAANEAGVGICGKVEPTLTVM